jgi:hypothetical protein
MARPREARARLPARMTEYRHRPHALSPEKTYRLDDVAIRCEADGAAATAIPYDQVRRVHLSFEPTRVQRNRYRLRITGRDGQRYDIGNEHYLGIADFQDRSPGYRHFVAELHRRLAGHPQVAYRAGNGGAQYLLNVLLAVFILAMLVLASWLLFTLGAGLLVPVKLAIIAFYLPTLWRYMARNRPSDYAPDAIPPGVLPALPAK